uniref:Uncharacterized protein n=1 Tax=Lepeophtheirus salmonis TaxID=72036 RepID=A0A0K2UA78_LEPSM
MSNKLYIACFICLLLSMTQGESFSGSDIEGCKQMDPMERIHNMTEYFEEERVKRDGKMVLCGHNLFDALRVACSAIRGNKSADVFSEEIMGMNDLWSNMSKRTGLTDQCCTLQPCSFTPIHSLYILIHSLSLSYAFMYIISK